MRVAVMMSSIRNRKEEDMSMKVGGGGRYKKLVKELAASGAKDPKALAASIGRKKYGKEKFQEMAAKGKK
jgi:histidyl-tRNA synthetase